MRKKMDGKIPFNKPAIIGPELYYIAQSVLGGRTSGDGPYAKRCQELIEELFQVKHVLLTTSCTSALEMAAILCGLRDGDEVILPSFTSAAAANTFLNRGATLVFADVRPDTLNIDEEAVADAVTARTKAIVPRHYAGVACEMDRLTDIAHQHGAYIIEDAAEGFNARYRGSALGTIGNMGAYSFHETKDIICGEGGAFVTNDDRLWERAELIREKGTNRSKFFRGQVDKYTWVDVGSSYVPSDILAAFLYAQLERIESVTALRRRIQRCYRQGFARLAARGLVALPAVPAQCEPNFHNFFVLVENQSIRDLLIARLKASGIEAVFHFQPLHTSPMGLKLGNRPGTLPVTEDISGRVLRFPYFQELRETEIARIVEAVEAFYGL